MKTLTSLGRHREERVVTSASDAIFRAGGEYQVNVSSSILSLHRWVGSAEIEEKLAEKTDF